MPIYEFKCKKCGNIFECICFRSDGADRDPCPSCGVDESERLLSTFSCGSSQSGTAFTRSSSSSACKGSSGFS